MYMYGKGRHTLPALLMGKVLMVFLHSRAEIHMNFSVNVVLNDGCLRFNLWLCTLFGFGVVSV